MEMNSFSEEVKNLHHRIFDAIANLLEQNNLERISFLGAETAEVYFDWDGSVACLKVDGVGFVDGALSVHVQDADCSEEEWEPIGLGSEVVYCTIDSVHDCTYKAVSACCLPQTFAYNGKKYICRYVQPKDVGLSDEVSEDVILIGPKSLDDALRKDGAQDNCIDRKVYFYTLRIMRLKSKLWSLTIISSVSYPIPCTSLSDTGSVNAPGCLFGSLIFFCRLQKPTLPTS